ncbi:MAG TPA: zf-HC2 domain-containing protein [Vicinamibacteria bacterium]|jgi:hypothetical protein|nr:zf-HC2 domain-containing protein [Vicinamibacteria bacterium]
MRCRAVVPVLSAYLDGDLGAGEARAIDVHLAACPDCRGRAESLCAASQLVSDLPNLSPCESVAARVLDRLEVESRGPGLALLFRSFSAARPLFLPSLIPAALILFAVLATFLLLNEDTGPLPPASVRVLGEVWDPRVPAAHGTESNPLFPSAEVSLPHTREGGSLPESVLAGMNEGTLFLETVVARDGSVSMVTLLGGDFERARPVVDALRRERFEPVRLHGRPVAVSVYRLISRLDVWPPLT